MVRINTPPREPSSSTESQGCSRAAVGPEGWGRQARWYPAAGAGCVGLSGLSEWLLSYQKAWGSQNERTTRRRIGAYISHCQQKLILKPQSCLMRSAVPSIDVPWGNNLLEEGKLVQVESKQMASTENGHHHTETAEDEQAWGTTTDPQPHEAQEDAKVHCWS